MGAEVRIVFGSWTKDLPPCPNSDGSWFVEGIVRGVIRDERLRFRGWTFDDIPLERKHQQVFGFVTASCDFGGIMELPHTPWFESKWAELWTRLGVSPCPLWRCLVMVNG